MIYPKIVGTICAGSYPGKLAHEDVMEGLFPVISQDYWKPGEPANTLTARNAGGAQRMPDKDNFQAVIGENHSRKYVIRRLTPLECCRLQGFPDWWTEGVEGSDSAQYKMWGNGLSLPNAADVLARIVKESSDAHAVD